MNYLRAFRIESGYRPYWDDRLQCFVAQEDSFYLMRPAGAWYSCRQIRTEFTLSKNTGEGRPPFAMPHFRALP